MVSMGPLASLDLLVYKVQLDRQAETEQMVLLVYLAQQDQQDHVGRTGKLDQQGKLDHQGWPARCRTSLLSFS